ncbi:hypothetical protein PASE110613_00255 [Paenibacillus sediminis]|uniref:CBS domain containing-hemolysin-like protein n=1 Tax=Paenibacillus sediminis TaxID=664909 RepID=A0ABS4H0F3_9BACL|nr:CBS domain containing-hemolysin-like protein [Paenibacillus sediminis]
MSSDPLPRLLNQFMKWFGISRASNSDYAEEKIEHLMKEMNHSGLIESTELALFKHIFEFADKTAREIMIPRTEMICLYAHHAIEHNLRVAYEGKRTRYPICQPDKDHIIGFIHIKDLILWGNGDDYSISIRPIMTVPDSIQISALLKLMQRGRTQIAVLIDEYGGTSGLVTLEDIMEVLIGEIQDEFDEDRPGIELIEEGVYSIDGLMLIDSVNERFGLELSSNDYDTIGGWMYSRIEIPPEIGKVVSFDEHLFIVEEVDHKRISRIRLLKEQMQHMREAGAI